MHSRFQRRSSYGGNNRTRNVTADAYRCISDDHQTKGACLMSENCTVFSYFFIAYAFAFIRTLVIIRITVTYLRFFLSERSAFHTLQNTKMSISHFRLSIYVYVCPLWTFLLSRKFQKLLD